MDILTVKDLGFKYDEGKFSIEDISFGAERGDFISVIGRNGSGKSTLVKSAAGIYKTHTGKVLFKDKNVKDYERKELSRSLSYIPQTAIPVNNELKVSEFLLLGRYSYKKFSDFNYSAGDKSAVEKCLGTAGIERFKDKRLYELSGGERQKVLIALAFVQLDLDSNLGEKLLIIDEPITHLDINYQHEIFSLLAKLNAEKKLTVIVVVHDLNLALKYTNKTLLMDKGKMAFYGNTRDVINEEMLNDYFMIQSKIINLESGILINYLPGI